MVPASSCCEHVQALSSQEFRGVAPHGSRQKGGHREAQCSSRKQGCCRGLGRSRAPAGECGPGDVEGRPPGLVAAAAAVPAAAAFAAAPLATTPPVLTAAALQTDAAAGGRCFPERAAAQRLVPAAASIRLTVAPVRGAAFAAQVTAAAIAGVCSRCGAGVALEVSGIAPARASNQPCYILGAASQVGRPVDSRCRSRRVWPDPPCQTCELASTAAVRY